MPHILDGLMDQLIDLTPECDQPLLASRRFVYSTMYNIVMMIRADRELAHICASIGAAAPEAYDGEGEHAAAWRVRDFLNGGTAWRIE